MIKYNIFSGSLRRLLKTIGTILFGVAITLIYDSSLLSNLRVDNPINMAMAWLNTKTSTSYLMLGSMVGCLFFSFLYIFLESCKVRIYKSIYFTDEDSRDVTEKVRKAFEEEGKSEISVNDVFLLGSCQNSSRKTSKRLMTEYSKFGWKRYKISREFDRLKI